MRKILKFVLIAVAAFVWLVGFAELLGTRNALLAVVLSVLLGEIVFAGQVVAAIQSHSMRRWIQIYLLEVIWYLFAIAGWGAILAQTLPPGAIAFLAAMIPLLTLPLRFALSDRAVPQRLPSGADEGSDSL